MTPEEHLAESMDSAQTANRLYEEGRPLQGAEMTWCSVKHAINAVGARRGLSYGTFRQKRQIVSLLVAEGYEELLEDLASARRLHVDSDHGFLDAEQILQHRRKADSLCRALWAIFADAGSRGT